MANREDQQDNWYLQAIAEFGAALSRLARAYESNVDRRKDLLQDIHFELWRSFASFKQQCSLRTWVYRIGHNVTISKRLRKRTLRLVGLDEVAESAVENEDYATNNAQDLERVMELIRQLVPPDNQVMLLYLEDMDAAAIGEITGLSPSAVAVRIHRVKTILARRLGTVP